MIKKRNKGMIMVLMTLIFISCINYSKKIDFHNRKEAQLDSIEFNKWVGDYVSDSLFVDSTEGLIYKNEPVIYDVSFAQFKLSIREDSSYFSLFKDGNVDVDYQTFNYLCKVSLIGDTVLLTTIKDVYGRVDQYENFKPIKKPVVKLFKKDNKILATSINYKKRKINYFLNHDYDDYGDTIELRKVHYILNHAGPQGGWLYEELLRKKDERN